VEQFEPRMMLANAAPSGLDASVTAFEDLGHTILPAAFGFSDQGDTPQNQFAAVKISAPPAKGALLLSGKPLSESTVVPFARLANGDLKFVPLPSSSGSPYADVVFQVQDDGGTANGGVDLDPTPNTISINVLPVNDPPIGKDKVIEYLNDGGGLTFGLSAFEFTDLADLPANTLKTVKIVALPTFGSLRLNGLSITSGQFVSKADISAGLLRYQPNATQPPSVAQDALTIQVQDDGGTANFGSDIDPIAHTISLTGFPFIGDPPIAIADKTVTMLEDWRYTFSPADFDFSSPVDGASLISITLDQNPVLNSLRYLGVPISVGTTIPAAHIQSGMLDYLPSANSNGSPVAKFAARVQDSVITRESPYTFGMNVIAVNDAPMVGFNTITTTEHTPYTLGVSDFGFQDLVDSPANNFYTVRIYVPLNGLLTHGGVPVRSGDVLLAHDIAAGKLKFTPAANASGVGHASIRFLLQDDGGTLNGGNDTSLSVGTITIDVTPVNDPPYGLDRFITIPENSTYTISPFDFGFFDPFDFPANNLGSVIIFKLPTLGSLSKNGMPVSAGQTIDAADIANGLLRFVAPPNINAFSDFQFFVQDNGGTANYGMDVALLPNTLTFVTSSFCGLGAPSVSRDTAITAAEDRHYTFRPTDFVIQSYDGYGEPLPNPEDRVKIVTLPQSGTLYYNGVAAAVGQIVTTIDMALGRLQFVGSLNTYGSNYAQFKYQVKDSSHPLCVYDSTGTVTIHVASVNDAPRGMDNWIALYYEYAPYTFGMGDFGFSDLHDLPVPNSLRAVIITTLPTVGSLTLNGLPIVAGQSISIGDIAAGALRFVPPMYYNVYPDFQFFVQDNGGTANGGIDTALLPNRFTFTVLSYCSRQAPPVERLTTIWALEDQPYVLTYADLGFQDVYGEPLSDPQGVKIVTLPQRGTLSNNGVPVTVGQIVSTADIVQGRLRYLASPNFFGTGLATFQYQVQDEVFPLCDDDGEGTVTINVTPVNDPPISVDRTLVITADSVYAFAPLDFAFADPFDTPANNFAAVKIASLPSVGTLTLQSVLVGQGQAISFVDIAAGLLRFEPPPNMEATTAASFAFQVQDNGGTANGGHDLSVSSSTITLRAINCLTGVPPINRNRTIASFEDRSYTFSYDDFGLTGPIGSLFDPPFATSSAVQITSLPSAGSLTMNGVAVQAGQIVHTSDILAGKLRFLPGGNAFGATYVLFAFKLQFDSPPLCPDNGQGIITFNVLSVNDPPSGADRNVTMSEDAAYTLQAGDFGFTDAVDLSKGSINQLKAVRIHALPMVGLLLIDWTPVTAGQLIAITEIQNQKLKFMPVVNANGSAYASFSFQVQDDGGTTNGGVDFDPTPNTITFNVTPVNDAPEGAGRNLSVFCNSYTFSPSDFGFSDSNDSPANNLLTVRLTNTGAGSLRFNGLAYTNNLEVTLAELRSGSLVYTPSGTTPTTITFQVKDDGGTAAGGGSVEGSDTDLTPSVLNITVAGSVNTAPVGIPNTVTTNEDINYVFKISDFRFQDPENNNLKSVTIGSPLPLQGALRLFNGFNFVDVLPAQRIDAYDIALGRLVFMPLPFNNHGSFFASLRFQVQDDGGMCGFGTDTDSVFRELTISVPSVNDAPEGTNKNIRVLGGGTRTLSLADFAWQDFNDVPSNGLLAVRVNSLPAAGSLTNNGLAVAVGQFISGADIYAGNFAFTPAANQPSVVNFVFQIQDDGGTENGGVDLDPTPNTIYLLSQPNHAPESADKTITIKEDTVGYFLASSDVAFADTGDAQTRLLQLGS